MDKEKKQYNDNNLTKNFTKIPNQLWKYLKPLELAIYTYIAENPKTWDFSANSISKEMFGVTRNTVGKALESLVCKGYLERKMITNRKMRYKLFYTEANYSQTSIFESCLSGNHTDDCTTFMFYLKEHNERFNEKHIPLKDVQIKRDCQAIRQLHSKDLITKLRYIDYVKKFLSNKSNKTDYHFPAFVNYVLGQVDEQYNGYDVDGSALTKDERMVMLELDSA